MEGLIESALESRNADEFSLAQGQIFPKYFETVIAFSKLARIVVPPQTIERITLESFCEMESDIREHALAAFGAEVRDQAIFTVWTLRKLSDICQEINSIPFQCDTKNAEVEFAGKFNFNLIWARFHLECLLKSMQLHRPIYPDVLPIIIDGLRAAVNAYAWARQGLDLRKPHHESEIAPVEWDEEDRALLEESDRDMLCEV